MHRGGLRNAQHLCGPRVIREMLQEKERRNKGHLRTKQLHDGAGTGLCVSAERQQLRAMARTLQRGHFTASRCQHRALECPALGRQAALWFAITYSRYLPAHVLRPPSPPASPFQSPGWQRGTAAHCGAAAPCCQETRGLTFQAIRSQRRPV